MVNNSSVKKLIAHGWYNDFEKARDILKNNTALDPDGTLMKEVETKLSVYRMDGENQCSSIKEIKIVKDKNGYRYEMNFQKPQAQCTYYVQARSIYGGFYDYIKSFMPEMGNMKIVLNQFNYNFAKNFIPSDITQNMAGNVGSAGSVAVKRLEKRMDEIQKTIDKLTEDRKNAYRNEANIDELIKMVGKLEQKINT